MKLNPTQALAFMPAKAILTGCIALTFVLTSCGGSANKTTTEGAATEASSEPAINETHFKVSDLVDLDLTSNGIPLTVKAPKDSKVLVYKTNGDVCVYGGKFFKLTFSQMDGAMADNMDMIKGMIVDKELNPSFGKIEAEDANGFLKADKDGKVSFRQFVQTGEKTVIISEGMPYDISPDQFTDYSNDDIKVMYEASKTAVAK
jgi:PBP1b-binding outer membrane lipoprotein LpoB